MAPASCSMVQTQKHQEDGHLPAGLLQVLSPRWHDWSDIHTPSECSVADSIEQSLPVGRDAPVGAHKRAVGRAQLGCVQAEGSLAWGPIFAVQAGRHAAAVRGRRRACIMNSQLITSGGAEQRATRPLEVRCEAFTMPIVAQRVRYAPWDAGPHGLERARGLCIISWMIKRPNRLAGRHIARSRHAPTKGARAG